CGLLACALRASLGAALRHHLDAAFALAGRALTLFGVERKPARIELGDREAALGAARTQAVALRLPRPVAQDHAVFAPGQRALELGARKLGLALLGAQHELDAVFTRAHQARRVGRLDQLPIAIRLRDT